MGVESLLVEMKMSIFTIQEVGMSTGQSIPIEVQTMQWLGHLMELQLLLVKRMRVQEQE